MLEEQQNQSPLGSEGATTYGEQAVDDSGGANGAATLERQLPPRITVEEAETLPFAELKRRMREEARLTEEGLLTAPSDGSGEAGDDGANVEPSGAANSGQNAGGANANNRNQATTQGQPPVGGTDYNALLAQAQKEAREAKAEAARIKEEQETATLRARHAQVEANINALPSQAQQEIARQHYMNTLNQQALNDYHRHLASREATIRQAELVTAKTTVPTLLEELATSVAERHGVKPDKLVTYIKSPQFKELISAAQDENALTGAAINAGQWMEFIATEEATQLATAREQRRLQRAQAPVARDTPASGVPAGGGLGEVARINSMTREEFFAHKKALLAQARNAQG